MADLRNIFNEHEGKLIHKWDHYFDIYERYLSQFRDREIAMLEIGVSHGGSLQMWKKYFGPKAKIFAIDVNPACKKLEEENIQIFIGSQSDRSFLESVAQQLPPLHFVIDDGGHTMKQQIVSFEVLKKYIVDDGVYICEDTHTSYWYEYHGALRKKGTFIEYCKDLIDSINAYHINDTKKLPVNEITQTINSIHFYDSMVVFEKMKRNKAPFSIMRGHETIDAYEEPEIRRKIRPIKDTIAFFKKGKQ